MTTIVSAPLQLLMIAGKVEREEKVERARHPIAAATPARPAAATLGALPEKVEARAPKVEALTVVAGPVVECGQSEAAILPPAALAVGWQKLEVAHPYLSQCS